MNRLTNLKNGLVALLLTASLSCYNKDNKVEYYESLLSANFSSTDSSYTLEEIRRDLSVAYLPRPIRLRSGEIYQAGIRNSDPVRKYLEQFKANASNLDMDIHVYDRRELNTFYPVLKHADIGRETLDWATLVWNPGIANKSNRFPNPRGVVPDEDVDLVGTFIVEGKKYSFTIAFDGK